MQKPVSLIEKIAILIPGYAGYAERNARRQCDKLLRDSITGKIFSAEKSVTRDHLHNINATAQDMNSWETCRKRLNTLNARIRNAPYGESTFFSSSQIKEDELLEIYKKDLGILDHVNRLSARIKETDAIDLSLDIDEIEKQLEERNEYIREFK